MTKEEMTKKLADIIFNAAKSGYMPYDTNDEMCAMNIAKKHVDDFYTSLPSNLDDAAEEHLPESHGYFPCGMSLNASEEEGWSKEQMLAMFKAGAKWMAEQGGTVTDACVIELNEDKGLNWLQMNGSNLCNALKNFNIGDKVIVQIRKK